MILLTNHMRKLSSACVFAEDATSILSSETIKRELLIPKLQILSETLQENNINLENLPPELQEKIKGIAEMQKSHIENYPLTIINQSLSTLCSLFELFLFEALESIFNSNPKTIISLSEEKKINLDQILELGSYEKLMSYFKDKILRYFSRASTGDQFNKYFAKLGFEISTFFDMSVFKPEVREKFKGWDLDKLISIFSERHSIVHDEGAPLSSLDELLLRKDYFEKIILNMAIQINKKFGIDNDLYLPSSLEKRQK